MRVRKTLHYIREREDEADWETCCVSSIPQRENLLRYLRATKSGRIYVLCGIDRKGDLRGSMRNGSELL